MFELCLEDVRNSKKTTPNINACKFDVFYLLIGSYINMLLPIILAELYASAITILPLRQTLRQRKQSKVKPLHNRQ
jgi:hypothetical protein